MSIEFMDDTMRDYGLGTIGDGLDAAGMSKIATEIASYAYPGGRNAAFDFADETHQRARIRE